nr:YdeI/OmpD-associated family protein [Clostridia bacterium]
YSRPNIERMIWLNERGMLLPEIREEVLPLLEAPFEYPEDIMEALKEDPVVWKNYEGFSEPYKRIRISYIDAARKRPEEFKKRLLSFIDRTGKGKLIRGYGGIEKYYR